jgi:hypothetical protein
VLALPAYYLNAFSRLKGKLIARSPKAIRGILTTDDERDVWYARRGMSPRGYNLADDAPRIAAPKRKTRLPHEIATNLRLGASLLQRGRFDDCQDFEDRSFTVAHFDHNAPSEWRHVNSLTA